MQDYLSVEDKNTIRIWFERFFAFIQTPAIKKLHDKHFSNHGQLTALWLPRRFISFAPQSKPFKLVYSTHALECPCAAAHAGIAFQHCSCATRAHPSHTVLHAWLMSVGPWYDVVFLSLSLWLDKIDVGQTQVHDSTWHTMQPCTQVLVRDVRHGPKPGGRCIPYITWTAPAYGW